MRARICAWYCAMRPLACAATRCSSAAMRACSSASRCCLLPVCLGLLAHQRARPPRAPSSPPRAFFCCGCLVACGLSCAAFSRAAFSLACSSCFGLLCWPPRRLRRASACALAHRPSLLPCACCASLLRLARSCALLLPLPRSARLRSCGLARRCLGRRPGGCGVGSSAAAARGPAAQAAAQGRAACPAAASLASTTVASIASCWGLGAGRR